MNSQRLIRAARTRSVPWLLTPLFASPFLASSRAADAPATEPAATAPDPLTLRAIPPTTEPSTDQAASEPAPPDDSGRLKDVVVTADLDRTRDQIAPSLGADTYTIGPNQVAALPGGESAPFSQLLLRAPGVVQDSFGQVHVRGDHNGLTYRVNGVLLPEGLNGFGQELDTRLVQSVTLITGALPAQFGFRTAGVVDVTTKSGATLNHNEFSLYGGSYDTAEPSIQVGGTDGNLDYFAVGSYRHSRLGIENPVSSYDTYHDGNDQEKLFTYLAYNIDDTSRLSLLLNASYGDFEIPDTPGLKPAFTLANGPAANSLAVNENQNEQNYYAVVSYQKTADKASLQLSAFTRYGQIRFLADPVQDLLFQGLAGNVNESFFTNGLQADLSYALNDRHTIRTGFQMAYTAESRSTDTAVFPTDASGAQSSDAPFSVGDEHGNWGYETGFYIQDEWKLTDRLTLNYGLRYDRFDASFEEADQLSPRVNVVWKVTDATTLHAGYARYFSPPTLQFIPESLIGRFTGTTNQPSNFGDSPTPPERSHWFDVGVSRQITPAWQVDVDGFYKDAKNLNDLGQFGSAIILSPFAYRTGHVEGAQVSSTYKVGGWSLYGNIAYVETGARGIESSQFLFDADELAYIRDHDIHLDHDSEFAGSAGVSYTWKDNMVYADILYGSGLRDGFANTGTVAAHEPVNVGYEHTFHPDVRGLKDVRLRFDVVNLFDQVYPIRDGSGIGVGAAQFGQRRSFYAGLTFDF